MTVFSAICLTDLWPDSKEESFSRIWVSRNDSLPCDFPVFISKLYECKQVELSAAFLAAFADF